MNDIRFFYSDKNLLEDLKEKLRQEDNDPIFEARHLLKIDFCLGIPLVDLQKQAVDYFNLCCEEYQKSKAFSALDYNDLLDAVFYLFASKYQFKNNDLEFLLYRIKITHRTKIKVIHTLENYAKVYLLLIANAVCNGLLDKEIITENKANLKDLFPQFEGLLIENTSALYEVIATDLTSIHRMKNLYINSPKLKTNGYQDFSTMYATFGKIAFWKSIGIELKAGKLNGLFQNEFGKEMRFFDY